MGLLVAKDRLKYNKWVLGTIITLAGIIIVALLQGHSYATRVGPVPSRKAAREGALALLEGANPRNIIELGSGWGGMTSMLAKRFPQSLVTGYELSWLPLGYSRLCLAFTPNAKTRYADIFSVSLNDADVVFCYLSPWHMQALAPKFAEMKPGSALVSISFPLLDKTPEKQTIAKGIVDIPVYLYRW